jgi:small subunit ribosomal protein S8
MSMTDPIADLLTRIRNGQSSTKPSVTMPSSRAKVDVCKVLKQEGFIEDYKVANEAGNKVTLTVALRYHEGRPVIDRLERVSTPSLRVYRSKGKLPKVMGGFGVAIVSTSLGVMTDREARARGQGGEVMCIVA